MRYSFKRYKFIGFMLTFLLFMVCFAASATAYNINENSSSIVASTRNYNLSIEKNSLSISTTYNRNGILQTEQVSSVFFIQNDTKYSLSKLIKVDSATDTLKLLFSTTQPEINASVNINFFDNYYTILVNTGKLNEKLGFNIELKNGENWYGGNITSAQNWPANSSTFEVDPFYATSNQTSPIWLSSKGAGVFVNTKNTMGYSFNKEKDIFSFHIKETNSAKVFVFTGNTIVDVYKSIIEIVGKPGQTPVKEYFSKAIFNSWIEFKKDVNQEGLIKYAGEIRKHGIPSAILEVDDMWTPAYGEFEFDAKKFPDPSAMIKSLSANGFKLALWVTPFVEQASKNYKFLQSKGYLIMEPGGKQPYITEWWNGKAALIDLSNLEAYNWFLNELKNLENKYGVKGFKLDAGDAEYLNKPFKSMGNITASQYADLFACIGANFEINELRVSWLTQQAGLVQRLRDKNSDWSIDKGIGSIVSHGMTEGLIGYPYFCPDMIGGGEIANFMENNTHGADAELFVRWAQASALMPMMQFSFAPWKLDSSSFRICKKYTELHLQLADYIYSLALSAKQTGLPIIRPLFFNSPDDSVTYTIKDQFMLGDRFLVAPVLTKGAVSRNVYLPLGTWIDFWNGNVISGGKTITDYPAPIDKLPIFINVNTTNPEISTNN